MADALWASPLRYGGPAASQPRSGTVVTVTVTCALRCKIAISRYRVTAEEDSP